MKSNYKPLSELVERIDVRNSGCQITDLIGLSIDKCFIRSVANTIGTDLSKYKVISKNEFAVSLMQVSRDSKIPVACMKEYDVAIMSPAYSIFRIKDESVMLPDYLDMWFKRPEFDREAAFIAVGGVRGSMPWDDFARMKIMVPDVRRQREIVNEYEVITNRIALKEQINDNLSSQCTLDYFKMLKGYTCESENLPCGWYLSNIGNYCDIKSGYAFKSQWWNDEGYKVIKIANIVNNSIDLDACDCVSPSHALKAKSFEVQSGDILIAMTGATTGKMGIVPFTDEPIVVNQRVGKFFLGDRPLEKNAFLYATLLSPNILHYLKPDGTAGSAQDNLSADDIKNIPVLYPDEKTIDYFNKMHKPYILTMMRNCTEIRRLISLSNVILQLLSSG